MATKETKELRIKLYDDLFGDGSLQDIIALVTEAKGYKIVKYITEGTRGVHRTLLPKERQVGEEVYLLTNDYRNIFYTTKPVDELTDEEFNRLAYSYLHTKYREKRDRAKETYRNLAIKVGNIEARLK